jgi:flagellar biosynthetic protein FliR
VQLDRDCRAGRAVSLPGLLDTAGEVVIGLALGFVLQFAFAAPMIAAEMIGASMGLSIATAADPVSGAHSPHSGNTSPCC